MSSETSSWNNPSAVSVWQETCSKLGISVGRGILKDLGSHLKTLNSLSKISSFVIIVDVNIDRIYGDAILQSFEKSKDVGSLKSNVLYYVIDFGEKSKNRATKAKIEDWMLENHCGRDTCIVAIGGGVVGDLSGFIASTFVRGIPFVQVPTTLLAMVDSSIGGKTGIDAPAGKNLIGSFYHPVATIIDLDFLSTLPPREFYNGMAEVLKTAAVWDESLFQVLENNSELIISTATSHSNSNQVKDNSQDIHSKGWIVLEHVILRTASIKAEVVLKDAKEADLRAILNWGHTIGHAIESEMETTMLHGECVAIGMVVETKLADMAGYLSTSSITGRLIRSIQQYHLPVNIPKSLYSNEGAQKLIEKMKVDKKNANKAIRMVMIKEIGTSIHHPIAIAESLLKQILSPTIEISPQEKPLNGKMQVPGSKSLSNRTLALTALAEGPCLVKGLLHADDTHVMLDALDQLNVHYEWRDHGETLLVEGSAGKFAVPKEPLYLGNAGTSSRFVTTMCTLMNWSHDQEASSKAANQESNEIVRKSAILTGSERLKERPIKDLIDALLENGCKIKYLGKEGFFPFEVEGTGLPGGIINISGEMSSQFISSILISAPYANNPVTLKLIGKTVSQPFIDMTTKLMSQFGITPTYDKSQNAYMIPKGIYKNPKVLHIESDASSASYPLAIAAITGGVVVVPAITSNSLQGDSMFANRVLKPMGCIVHQDENETRVEGPKDGLKAIEEIDMDEMTDTFMTAAVLAAVAKGTTKIVNIANQRVKECNRIEAMVTEFTKIGIKSRELPDGIEIEGTAGDFSKLNKKAFIECYKDHRIAMSFAVLGCVVPGIVILDKDCTDKTFPEFWISLQRNFGVQYCAEPGSTSKLDHRDQILSPSKVDQESNVVIIGMRGTGKTTLGAQLAQQLNRKFIDMDNYFVESKEYGNGKSIQEFVKQHSWDEFRVAESKLLQQVLESHPKNTVIATGGGIIETEHGRAVLQKASTSTLVVHLSAQIEDVKKWLESQGEQRANLGEEVSITWQRRQPIYIAMSHYEFCIPSVVSSWDNIGKQFAIFVKRILAGFAAHLKFLDSSVKESYFLSLTYPDYLSLDNNQLKIVVEGSDAVELRVDLIKDFNLIENVRNQYACLRDKLHQTGREDIPIVYTVRTKNQGGAFEGSQQLLLQLIQLGIRLGAHFVDFEADLPPHILEDKKISSIIASLHDWNTIPSIEHVHELFSKCFAIKEADIAKVVVAAHNNPENVFVMRSVMHDIRNKLTNISAHRRFIDDISAKPKMIPLIGIVAGASGKLSRVVNEFLTPVTHPALPFKAAPGQLSVEEIKMMKSMLSISSQSEQ